MPYRVDVPRADDAVLDRLVELGALDVDRSPGGGIAALMPDSVAPDQVAYALGLDDLSIAPAIGRDTDSVWILTPRAIRIGRLRIVPADASAEPGVLRLTDSPAFGTGLHATTAMCLEVIDEALEHSTPGAVLDVGTGSGVLALAALLMGVPRALGLDIDAGALRAAAENARLNGLDRRLHLARGGPEAVTGAWPLVVANLLAAPLVELAPVLVRRVGHHGRLVLSGIPSSVEGDVDRTYRRLGMQHVRALHARGGAHSCWRHHGEWRRRCTGCTQPDWRGTHAAPPRRLPMGPARLSRRQFLTTTAATAALTAAGRAPAFAQGTRLHLLQWSHFVPAADRLFDEQAAEFGKQAGVQVQLERINQNDIQPRVTAAVQSGSGADIIILANNHPLLYESSLVDVTDVAEEIGSKQGGWHDYVKANCVTREKRWVAVPQYIISWAVTYREDWFKEAGFAYPKTWDEFRTVGRAMKAKGKPFGQAFGHSINDPNNWCYPLLWMWGGMEVQGDGRTVALSSKNAVEAVRFNTVLWKEVFDEGGLAWDDSNNNRAFLASEISLTGNAPSIYVAARGKFPDVYKGTNHGHFPPGPAGRFYWLPAWNSCVMRYSKQQKVAKDFIRFYMDRKQFDPYFVTMDTFGIPGTKVYSDHPLWKKDPRTAVFPETLPHARQVGYAGPAGRKATEALSKYIIVDMFAKAIQGMKPEDAVAWAAGELGKIYAA